MPTQFAMAALTVVLTLSSVPAQQGGSPPPAQDRPGGQRGGPGFHLLPRFALDRLNLSEDQLKQVADLERETKAKLAKILTPEQMKTLEELRPPRPGQGGASGPGDAGGPPRPERSPGGRP